MKKMNCVPVLTDSTNKKSCYCNILPAAAVVCIVFFVGSSFITNDYKIRISRWGMSNPMQTLRSSRCKEQCRLRGSEPLPKGIISAASNLEMRPLWGFPRKKKNGRASKSLLAMAVGARQKETVNKIVKKFPSSNFTVMLFHYDGIVDEWRNLPWSDSALHVSAVNQTKWWFAKRFLHPDIVAEYDYIFLWDEDLGVDNFHPGRYLAIVEKEGLEISQPALDPSNSQVHHRITVRSRRTRVHRRIYKFRGGGRCYENSTAPPCTGWVEMMAPVFSRAAWRCAWYMIQNDLIHAWGLDMKLGYCAQGDRSKNVGVVDAEYIVHQGIPTLGGPDENKVDLVGAAMRLSVKPVHKELGKKLYMLSLSSVSTSDSCVSFGSAINDVDRSQVNAEAPSDASELKRMLDLGTPVVDDSPARSWVRRQSLTELEIFKGRWEGAVKDDECWIDPYPPPLKTSR